MIAGLGWVISWGYSNRMGDQGMGYIKLVIKGLGSDKSWGFFNRVVDKWSWIGYIMMLFW